jgi:hypothetical protein
MQFTIQLDTQLDSQPDILRLADALTHFAGSREAFTPAAASTGTPAADAPKGGRGKGSKTQPAETPSPDAANSAATDAAAEAASATAKAAESAKNAEPDAPKVAVEEIRAVAAEFNTDDTRPFAIALLSSFGLSSVSASKDLPDAKRAELLAALKAKRDELKKQAEAAALT